MGVKKPRKTSRKPPHMGTRKSKRLERNAQTLFSQAVEDFQKCRFTEAAKKADELLELMPNSGDVIQLRGLVDLSLRNYAAASERFQHGLSLEPNNPRFSELLGTALLEMGAHHDAVIAFRRALSGDARNAAVYNNLGAALVQIKDYVKAEEAFRNSLIYRPTDIPTQLNLADVLLKRDQHDLAEAAYRQLIDQNPTVLEAYQALGEIQMKERNWQAALETANQAIEQGFRDAEIYTLKGFALGAHLNFDEAQKALSTALELEPGRPSTRVALSILNFYRENWADAWDYYEARFEYPPFFNRPHQQARWSGESLKGNSILLWGEQGVGDEVLFASQIPDIKKQCDDITLEMDERLVPLFKRSFADVTCVGRKDELPPEITSRDFDYQCPTGSLGRYLRTDEAAFAKGAAFLSADKKKTQSLRQKYRNNENQRLVGVAWYSSNGKGLSKSIPLTMLQPLFEVPNTKFVNLQYGDTNSERAQFLDGTGFELINDETIDQMASIDDFAAQIAALDLVISISNTTVHLAGALGVPTWIMLPAAPMQRWLINRSDSPWYGSVELFRQRKEDDWEYVVGCVANRLRHLA